MKKIKRLFVALAILLCSVACDKTESEETLLGTSPVYVVSDVVLIDGVDSATSVTKYWIYYELSDLVVWQTDKVTDRYNKIEEYRRGTKTTISESGEVVSSPKITFEEVYPVEQYMVGNDQTIMVNRRRQFEIVFNEDDGLGTMTVVEYDNSTAEYSVSIIEQIEYMDI